MITHHHHEDLALGFSVNYVRDNNGYKHDKENTHNHDSQKKENDSGHKHHFPRHHHVFTACDLDIIRTNLLESNTQIRDIAMSVVLKLFSVDFSVPPNFEDKLYFERKFLISSLCKLETIVLRGPPAIV